MAYLYHYTSRKSAKRIEDEGILRACRLHGDRTAPKAVYLTQVHPDLSREKILINNYNDGETGVVIHKLAEKAEFYFKFESTDLPEVTRWETEKDTWIYPRDILLHKIAYEGCNQEDVECSSEDSDGSDCDSYGRDCESDTSSGEYDLIVSESNVVPDETDAALISVKDVSEITEF